MFFFDKSLSHAFPTLEELSISHGSALNKNSVKEILPKKRYVDPAIRMSPKGEKSIYWCI